MVRHLFKLNSLARLFSCLALFLASAGDAQKPPPVSNVVVTCQDSVARGFLSNVLSPFERLCIRHRPVSVASIRFKVNATQSEGEILFIRLGADRAITSRSVNGALLFTANRKARGNSVTSKLRFFPRQAGRDDLEAVEIVLASPAVIAAALECVGQPPINAGEAPIDTCQNSGNWLKDRFAEEWNACRAEGAVPALDCDSTNTGKRVDIDAAVSSCLVMCNCRCCKNPDSGCDCG